jgi:hypothetical protein
MSLKCQLQVRVDQGPLHCLAVLRVKSSTSGAGIVVMMSVVWGQAEFQVTLQYPNDMVALSNTPVEDTWGGTKDGTAMSRFGRTPLMSPYLLAVCIGVLKNQTMISQEYMYNVVGWSTPDLSYQLSTGLQVSFWTLLKKMGGDTAHWPASPRGVVWV